VSGKNKKPLRHSQDGGYTRGDETRQRIIDAAIEVFGEQGFDAATTRQIALHAGVNPPALQYYFENKEGVYLACAEHLATENRRYFQPVISQILQLDDQADTECCITLFCQLLDAMLDRVFSQQHSQNKRLFHARVQMGQGPQGAFQVMREQLGRELGKAGAKLVARVTQTSEDLQLTQLRTLSLLGQVVMFHNMRRSVLDQLQWNEVDEEKLIAIKHMLREHCRTLMLSWQA
jgi:AcrR family transcriptional regulator